MYGIVSDLVKGTYNMVSLRDNTPSLRRRHTTVIAPVPYDDAAFKHQCSDFRFNINN